MYKKLVDEYISEVTENMSPAQRKDVDRELRTHIMDSADALASERKAQVDEAIIREVIARMGPANKVATLYQKPKLFHGRPKIVPPPTKADLVIEAVALIGFLFNIGLIIYGFFNLPDIVPTHVGPSGGIDSYGSKWQMLIVSIIQIIILYPLLTIANRYPYILNYPAIVTEENAPRLYRLARSMMRWIKAIFVWMIAIMAWEQIMVLPYNPGQSGNGLIILLISTIIVAIVLVYYVIKLVKAGASRSKTVDS